MYVYINIKIPNIPKTQKYTNVQNVHNMECGIYKINEIKMGMFENDLQNEEKRNLSNILLF